MSSPEHTPPSRGALAAGLATGSVALLMLGLQPVLLGGLADAGRISNDQIGFAATAELLALGLTTGTLASLAPPARLRAVNVLACLALAGINALCLGASGWGIVAARGAAGVAGGVMVWIAVALITRARWPDRVSGVFLAVQTLAQAALAALLPVTLMPRFGVNGGLASLGVIAALSAACSIWLPDRLAALPKPAQGDGGVPIMGLLGLGHIFLHLSGIVGLWVFAERLASGAGVNAQGAGLAVALALAAQVSGSAAATFLAGRLPTLAVLAACGVADIAIVAALGHGVPAAGYFAAIILFGFLWLFSMPFQVRLLVDLDPSRRAAMLLSAAQLLGSAAGPVATSAFATDASLAGALWADAGLFAGGVGFVVVIAMTSGRKEGLLF